MVAEGGMRCSVSFEGRWSREGHQGTVCRVAPHGHQNNDDHRRQQQTAAAIAYAEAVDDFSTQATRPSELSRSLQAETADSATAAGDGTNDAGDLAQADVAVAMNTGFGR